jgi:hypothetical protein
MPKQLLIKTNNVVGTSEFTVFAKDIDILKSKLLVIASRTLLLVGLKEKTINSLFLENC